MKKMVTSILLLLLFTLFTLNTVSFADEMCYMMRCLGEEGDPEVGTNFDNAKYMFFYQTDYLSEGQEIYYKKYIDNSAQFIFETEYYIDNLDTYAYLYDNNRNLIAENDDGGNGFNFKISKFIKYHVPYVYIKVRAYNSSYSGYFKITADKDVNCSCNNHVSNYQMHGHTERTITWDSSWSKYQSEIAFGINVWSDLGVMNFLEDYGGMVPFSHVFFFDYYDDSSGRAVAYYSGGIHLNDYYYVDYMSDLERKKTIMHEIGHALGINDNMTGNESDSNVMHQGIRERDTLGPCDKAVYYHILYDQYIT